MTSNGAFKISLKGNLSSYFIRSSPAMWYEIQSYYKAGLRPT